MAERSPSDFQRARISAGTRLNGIYEIDSLIGIGGMGEIYKGHAIQTGDLVAIKLMLPELAENEAALALFRKEASALHNLQHDAIIRYYVSTVEPQLQRPYLAMEFVDGRSLSEILKDDGPLPFEAVRALMLRVSRRPDGRTPARHHSSRRLARQHHRAGRRRLARQDHRLRHRALHVASRRHRYRQRLCWQAELRVA